MPAEELRCEVSVIPEGDPTGENAIECGAIAVACAAMGLPVVSSTLSSADTAGGQSATAADLSTQAPGETSTAWLLEGHLSDYVVHDLEENGAQHFGEYQKGDVRSEEYNWCSYNSPNRVTGINVRHRRFLRAIIRAESKEVPYSSDATDPACVVDGEYKVKVTPVCGRGLLHGRGSRSECRPNHHCQLLGSFLHPGAVMPFGKAVAIVTLGICNEWLRAAELGINGTETRT